MSMMAASLAVSPLVRFTIPEREYVGDGIPRKLNGEPLDWYMELISEEEKEKKTWE